MSSLEPNASRIEEALNACEFLVCQEIFHNETTRFADVIFPGACFAEKDGVFTNSDRRVQRVRKAVEAPGQARADWQISSAIWRALWVTRCRTMTVRRRLCRVGSALAPNFSGISHARIDAAGGLQWPCPSAEHPGTRTLHESGPIRGKGIFQAVAYRPSAESADASYPLVLSTGRTLYQYNSATQTRRDPGTVAKNGSNFVEVHRHDARKLGS
ncbi:MAG: molybdopterin-dependent oxidoreductase [Myxococcota bacterium]